MPLITDPIDLKLDEDNQLVFVDGDLVFTTGIEAVVQQCRIALQMFREEWFLNLDVGMPYFQSILGHKPNIAIAAARIYISSELLAIEGVTEITRLDITYRSDRTLVITWQVQTQFGETPADEINLRVLNGTE